MNPQNPNDIRTWSDVAENLVRKCEISLSEHAHALGYLYVKRGLKDASIKQARLGYASEWKHFEIEGERYSLAPGIIIPYFEDGKVMAVRVRTRTGNFAEWLGVTDELGMKYMSLRGSLMTGTIYNFDSVNDGDEVLICEGEFDAILAAQEIEGVKCVTLGSASARLSEDKLNKLRKCKSVYIALDNDAAGDQGSINLISQLLGIGEDAFKRGPYYNWVTKRYDFRAINNVIATHAQYKRWGDNGKAFKYDSVFKLSVPRGDLTDLYNERVTDLDVWFETSKWRAMDSLKVLGEETESHVGTILGVRSATINRLYRNIAKLKSYGVSMGDSSLKPLMKRLMECLKTLSTLKQELIGGTLRVTSCLNSLSYIEDVSREVAEALAKKAIEAGVTTQSHGMIFMTLLYSDASNLVKG